MTGGLARMDVQHIRNRVDLVELVGRYVDLRRVGSEFEGLCPFHSERSPSFKVNPAKQFCFCFGCGASHDAIGFLMRVAGLTFREACRDLNGVTPHRPAVSSAPLPVLPATAWVPVYPVPDNAPAITAGGECRVWNAKRGRWWTMRPTRADAYRDARGELIGYVLRVDFASGEKVTPCVTWCIGPDGSMRWCLRPFLTPRPLCGLDDLAAKPSAPVLVVEGEKCRAAAAAALPQYAAVTWPGGSKGVRHVDFTPLAGRDVVLWPDADEPGRVAMLGCALVTGALRDGVAQQAWRAGCTSLRFVDVASRPKGWDVADALGQDGWTPRQLAAWAALHVCDISIDYQPDRRAA